MPCSDDHSTTGSAVAPSRPGSRCVNAGEEHRPAQRPNVGEGHQGPPAPPYRSRPETLSLLGEHRHRCEARASALELALTDDAFMFSLAVDGSEHLKPDSASQRYARLARRLDISTTIHKLRHYSATELISAGVDVRTVAGRLGHGGGGPRRSRSTRRGCPRAISTRPRVCSPGYLPGLTPLPLRLFSAAAVVTRCICESLSSCAHRLPQVSFRWVRSYPRISISLSDTECRLAWRIA